MRCATSIRWRAAPSTPGAATRQSLPFCIASRRSARSIGWRCRAAARVACEQAPALACAARLLGAAARAGGCVWITGLGADDHRRRLHAKGHRALVWPDRERLPGLLGPRDVLLVTVSDEAPSWLREAQRRRTLSIVLGGPGRIEHDQVEASLRVPCYDEGTLELAHAFIVLALCAEGADGGA